MPRYIALSIVMLLCIYSVVEEPAEFLREEKERLGGALVSAVEIEDRTRIITRQFGILSKPAFIQIRLFCPVSHYELFWPRISSSHQFFKTPKTLIETPE